MSSLLYRQDMDQVRQRLTTWWQGGDIGRPPLLMTAPREEPLEAVPAMPEPPGWTTHYSTSDFAYRVNQAARTGVNTWYLGEAVPQVAPDLGANCLALYLGCQAVDGEGTVWFEPCIEDPEAARFEFDPDNFYWDFTLRLAREQLRLGQGKFLLQFPDLIEGLDTLAAMRGTEELLIDLIDRPEWVRAALDQITELYFKYYDILYDLFKDETGGSHFWSWAPGRMAKFQCDFSAMLSPSMFADFMVPVLREMTARVDYCMYHWDGPGALAHHDLLLDIPDLTMLQWTPGAGAEPGGDSRWWPLYHKTIEAGKKVYVGVSSLEELRGLKREFGPRLKQFLISLGAGSRPQADEILRLVSD